VCYWVCECVSVSEYCDSYCTAVVTVSGTVLLLYSYFSVLLYYYSYCQCYCTVTVTVGVLVCLHLMYSVTVLLLLLPVFLYCYYTCQFYCTVLNCYCQHSVSISVLLFLLPVSSYSYCYCQCYCTVTVTVIVSVLLILLSVFPYSVTVSGRVLLPSVSHNVTVAIGGRVLLLLKSVLLYCYCNGRVPVTVPLLQCFPSLAFFTECRSVALSIRVDTAFTSTRFECSVYYMLCTYYTHQ